MKKTAKTKKTAKKTIDARHDGKNRYAFITSSQMNGKPAAEVAAAAKKAGYGDINPKYVYTCRSMATARAKKNVAKTTPTNGRRRQTGATNGGGVDNNALLMLESAAAEVGLGTAIAHLQEMRSKTQKLVASMA